MLIDFRSDVLCVITVQPPPSPTHTCTLFPFTTLFRSLFVVLLWIGRDIDLPQALDHEIDGRPTFPGRNRGPVEERHLDLGRAAIIGIAVRTAVPIDDISRPGIYRAADIGHRLDRAAAVVGGPGRKL